MSESAIDIRTCKTCLETKSMEEFGNRCTIKSGRCLECKSCVNKKAVIRNASLTDAQRQKRKETHRAYQARYRQDGFEISRKYEDLIVNKLRIKFRASVEKAYRIQDVERPDDYVNLLGCSFEDFKKHIESLFEAGMTWENHGDWEYDHKKPCCSFDLFWHEEAQKCFHYSNLRPHWKNDHSKKSKNDIRNCAEIKRKSGLLKNRYIISLEERLRKYEEIDTKRPIFITHKEYEDL